MDADAPSCRRWLDNPFYRAYGVLKMGPLRDTLQYGVVVSKAMTAREAQAPLEARWTPLIDAAPEFLPFDATDLTGSSGDRLTGNRRFDNRYH